LQFVKYNHAKDLRTDIVRIYLQNFLTVIQL
jgi:hypothetical protein